MDAPVTTLATTRLTDRSSFPAWYAQLKYHAKARGLWAQLDPDVQADRAPLDPPETPSQDADIEELRIYQIKANIHAQLVQRTQAIWNWVNATVDPQRIELAMLTSDGSLQQLIRELKNEYCPSDDDWREQVRAAYRDALQQQEQSGDTWLMEWKRAYASAKIVNLQEIKGTLAIKDFLRVTSRYAPGWASRELDALARPGAAPSLTLEQYAEWFAQLIHQSDPQGVFATFGGPPAGAGHKCPCRSSGTHRWKPQDCRRLQYAINGSTNGELKEHPSTEDVVQIRDRLRSAQWKQLAAELNKAGDSQFPGGISA